MADVQETISKFENAENTKIPSKSAKVKAKKSKQPLKTRCHNHVFKPFIRFWKESRLAGLPLAPIYGLYLYYMIAFLIFTEPVDIDFDRSTNFTESISNFR